MPPKSLRNKKPQIQQATPALSAAPAVPRAAPITQPQASEPAPSSIAAQPIAAQPIATPAPAVPSAEQAVPSAEQAVPSAALASSETPAPPSTLEPLPQGWEELREPSGRVYYGNPTLQITQYERPRVLPSAEERQEERQEEGAPSPSATAPPASAPPASAPQLNDDVKCNVFSTLFGGADYRCHIQQPLPQAQEFLKGLFFEKISNVGSRFITDILIATGNEALVNAVLAKSMTPQQAELLKKVSDDPKVAEALEQVKDRLLEGVKEAGENFETDVLPEVQTAVVQVMENLVNAVQNAIADIPFVGDAMSVIDLVTALIAGIRNTINIKEKIGQALEPVKEAVGQMGELTTALDTAATSAAAGLSDQASSTVAGVSLPNATPGPNKGGGSRTRRRIHKLSRRIERTLRRVQKKYGLQDKNSFLRRTLKRK